MKKNLDSTNSLQKITDKELATIIGGKKKSNNSTLTIIKGILHGFI